jgi:hypothetical protein
MRLYILLLLCLFYLCCEDLNKDPNTIMFTKVFGGNDKETGYSVQQTADNGYIITGNTLSFGNGNYDSWVVKTDSKGKEEWNRSYGGSLEDQTFDGRQTTDGGYIFCGRVGSFGNGRADVWLIKTDAKGQKDWEKNYGWGSTDFGYEVKETNDGGYIIIGVTDAYGRADVWLIKTDFQGNEEWNRIFGENDIEYGFSVQQTTDGGYIVSGETKSFGNGHLDFWLIKTDYQGHEEWNKTFGGENMDRGYSVLQTEDGGYIICGQTLSFGDDYSSGYLVKTDSEGNEEWNRVLGGSGYGRTIQQTEDGGYIIAGSIYSNENNSQDVWLIKTDSQGTEEWNKTYGGIEWEYGHFVSQTTDGGYIITGSTESYGNGEKDMLLIKTDSEGNTNPFED